MAPSKMHLDMRVDDFFKFWANYNLSLRAVNSQFPPTSQGQSLLWLVRNRNLSSLIGCLLQCWNVLLHAFLLPLRQIYKTVCPYVGPSVHWFVRLSASRSVGPSICPYITQIGYLIACWTNSRNIPSHAFLIPFLIPFLVAMWHVSVRWSIRLYVGLSGGSYLMVLLCFCLSATYGRGHTALYIWTYGDVYGRVSHPAKSLYSYFL